MLLPIAFLRAAGRIHSPPARALLDIGIGDGRNTKLLMKLGYFVEAVDPDPMVEVPPGVIFHRVSLEKFVSQGYYDFVFARHVLPMTDDPIANACKLIALLKPGGVIVATFFGRDQQWQRKRGDIHKTSFKQAKAVFNGLRLLYWGTDHHVGKSMLGDVRLWHVHTFIAEKPY